MAGIGFELKKIYGRNTLSARIMGTLYAAMATVGPIILMAAILLILQLFLSLADTPEIELRFFISATTYAFTVALMVSVLLTSTISRYVADCIFLHEEDKICAAMYGSMALCSAMSGVAMLYLCMGVWNSYGGASWVFIVSYYFLGIAASNAYILMAYASALNRYKAISAGFLAGLLISAATYYILHDLFSMGAVTAACTALTVCFTVIVLVLVYQCVKAFYVRDSVSFKFLAYFKKYPYLTGASIFYALGLYGPTLLYWFFSGMRESISIFTTAPTYDVAYFLAFLVNLPALVIFVVKVETSFYDVYQTYVSALNTGSYPMIEKELLKMGRVLKQQLFFLYEIQFVLTVICICLLSVYMPYLNFSASVINMFVLQSLGIYAIFCMNFTVIVLYYFADYKNAFAASLLFFLVITGFAVISLSTRMYALPSVIAGITGWIAAFLMLRHRLNNLTAFLMC